MQWLVSTTRRLGLRLPAEQLNQQEIQSQSINWWNNFNHSWALSRRRKTLTNGAQLLHFLLACFQFVVFFPSCPLNSLLECNSEIWQPSRQPYAAKHGGVFLPAVPSGDPHG